MCSRPGCLEGAVARLDYAYASSKVEVCPIEEDLMPGAYVLCQSHLDKLRLPKDWELIVSRTPARPVVTASEIEELARRVREAGGLGPGGAAAESEDTEHSLSSRNNLVTLTSRAHLKVVADSAGYDGSRAAPRRGRVA